MQSRHIWMKELLKDLSGIYVEIGVCWGGNSEFLLNNTPCKKLFSVDPYKHYPQSEYNDALNLSSQLQLDQKYHLVKNTLSKYGNRSELMRLESCDARYAFRDKTLDFVYIDGNHSFEYAKEDILYWLPKIRIGGILAGDDVESLDLPHKDGSAYVEHIKGGPFGYYGVHTALQAVKNIYPWFSYKIEGNQFFWQRKF